MAVMRAPVSMPMSGHDWQWLATLATLWSFAFFFTKIGVTALPPLSVAFVRIALAAAALAAILTWRGAPALRTVKNWPAFLIMAAINNAVPFSLIAVAQTSITSGFAATLNGASPLFSVLLAHAIGAERLSGLKIAGVVLGLAGVAALLTGSSAGVWGLDAFAMTACLGAAFLYACSGLYGRRLGRLSALEAAAGQLIAATLVMAPVVAIVDRPWTLPMPAATTIAALAGLALFGTAAAYVVYFRLLASAGATNLLLVTLLMPIGATALGVAFLDERFSFEQALGMAAIGVGILAVDGRVAGPRRA